MITCSLPNRRPDRVWGGAGSGAPCAVCGKTIGTEDVEIELQFTCDKGLDTGNYHVHAQCFAAWELERRNGAPTGHSLLQTGNGGIMPDRERNGTIRGEQG